MWTLKLTSRFCIEINAIDNKISTSNKSINLIPVSQKYSLGSGLPDHEGLQMMRSHKTLKFLKSQNLQRLLVVYIC